MIKILKLNIKIYLKMRENKKNQKNKKKKI